MNEHWRACLGGTYEASNLGRIRRVSSGRIMSVSGDGRGYLKVSVCLQGAELTRLVHGLVAEAFIGPRPTGAQINHKDGRKTNNRPENLEYCTAAENSAHSARTGLAPSGKRHGRNTKPHRTARGTRVNTAVLTESDVVRMRKLRADGTTLSALMVAFGMSKSGVHQVVTRKSWRHVP